MARQVWAFLADPEDFGWKELARDGKAVWDGVKNAVAQRNLRACEVDDLVLIYHTAPDKALVGVARVTAPHRADPRNKDLVVVDVAPVKPLARPLPLSELKSDAVLSQMSFVRMPRVAVQPITSDQLARVLAASGTKL